jgi:ubiquitin-conjugating enzyme E2 D/E
MLARRLNQEIKELSKSPIPNCSAGPEKDDISKWDATIFGPEGTPYENGIFKLKIDFTSEYPFKPPIIRFVTKIYHCNINNDGYICLDILSKNWSPVLSIGKVLISICSLLAEPNPDDPLVGSIADLLKKNKKLHDSNAKEYTVMYANI